MHSAYLASVFIHILAAAFWVGGMAFFAIVVVPAARRELDERTRGTLLRAAGKRLASASMVTLGVLVLTGFTNLHFRSLLPSLAHGEFWATPFGHVLGAKLVLVTLVIAASTLHSRQAMREASGAAGKPNRMISMLGRGTLVLSIVVVGLAIMLVRGTP